jgi:membrane protein required for colicin V production
MTGFDIAVLIVVGLGAVTGFLRGFVQEVLALLAWIFSLFAIHSLHTPLTVFLEPRIGTGSGASVLAFAILLLVPYGATKALANWLGAASRTSVLGPIDRVIGFGFGAVKGTVISVLAFSVLVLGYDTVWGVGGRPEWITLSRSYPFINASSEALVDMIAARRHSAAEAETKRIKGH